MRLLLLPFLVSLAVAQDGLKSKTTYSKAYGETKNAVAVDPAKDLPRYPAVEPKDAIATWKVKPGFKLQLAAHEPQVRSPIAISFDENGRMFVCEMIDYSEMRDAKPHLGRISLLEDKDGDGYYETSRVFADDLPWPTGLIWANGGLYLGATPDIWRFEDRDGDGRAEVREKVFTGFGTGLKLLNVQGLMNSFQWGQDNRIHVLAGGGNRGEVKCLKRPDLPAIEIGGRDFWFDPRTHEFGLEAGGAQYGMSFDNFGRKFGCSNSDHLQYWVYDDRVTAGRNPFFNMPPSRQSIAADGGAAEVFRLSPDEPWRIIRTRWRIAGVVKGAVEGGGRVSGYFTGATGTTAYRGDAYGQEFKNNTFSGDAGGQLVHRKKILEDGASLVGQRPDDEKGFEFAASKDTWVRVVNFANAPDGCLHICDMYREVIEHPWSIPDEIKKHIDLNSGNDRGRIYRIVPDDAEWKRRSSTALGKADVPRLVELLSHSDGWHRDTASRLLYERQDKSAVPLLEALFREPADPMGRLHALGVLSGLGALSEDTIARALADTEWFVRERGVVLSKDGSKLLKLVEDPSPRVRFQVALKLEDPAALTQLAFKDHTDKWISAAILSHSPQVVAQLFAGTRDLVRDESLAPFLARQIEIRAAAKIGVPGLIDFVAGNSVRPLWVRALGDGLRRAGTTIEKADTEKKLAAVFTKAAATAVDAKASPTARLEAIELLGFTPGDTLKTCLAQGQPDAIQAAAIKTLAQRPSADVTKALLDHWPHYGAKAKEAVLTASIARDDRAKALLATVEAGAIKASDLSAAQVQSLAQHKDAQIAALAKKALASVLPPSREEMTKKFQPAVGMKGDAVRGLTQYQTRCLTCHRAAEQGMQVGPDLITVKTKGRDALLTAILEPHKEVASQYIAYTVSTKDEQMFTGIISADDANSLTLRSLGGIEQTIARSNIKGSSSTGQSLMPEGLETGLDVQGMADLLTFIEELK